jgi:hypothetical protein
MNLNGTPDGARCHRVFVVIEAHQAGLGFRLRWQRRAARAGRDAGTSVSFARTQLIL